MKLNSVTRTPSGAKAFKAIFTMDDGRQKTVRFGTNSNYVSNKDKTIRDRTNYIKRHAVRENFNDPTSAGALSRWLLWGNSRNLAENVRAFRRRFNV